MAKTFRHWLKTNFSWNSNQFQKIDVITIFATVKFEILSSPFHPYGIIKRELLNSMHKKQIDKFHLKYKFVSVY